MPEKTYTAKQMADLSGVSVRTLHYYEEVGLLCPRRTGSNYRQFGPGDVERLQQVLLYRACGMALADIKVALDAAGFDAHAALESHLARLHGQRQELETVIANVEKTLATMEGRYVMNDKERFEGLKRNAVAENEEKYGAEARAAYGDAAIDAANERVLGMSEAEWNDAKALEESIKDLLRAALATGDPAGEKARDLCRMHARWLSLQWGAGAYSAEAHAALAEGYVADPRFTAYYDDACGEGATAFLRDALVAWCRNASSLA